MGAYDNSGYRKAFGAAEPLTNYSFILRVEGVYEIPIKGVRAFQKQNNFEKIREGGINDFVHLRRMPIQEPFTIQIERYVSNSVFDPLSNGTELMLPLILQVMKTTKFSKSSGSEDQDTGKIFVFTGCAVMGKEYGELNSEQSGLATEIVTIGYKELWILPNITALGGESPKNIDSSSNNTARLAKDKENKEAEEKKRKAEEAQRKANKEKEKKDVEDEKKRRYNSDEKNKARAEQDKKNKEAEEKRRKAEEEKRKANKEKEKKDVEDEKKRRYNSDEKNKARAEQDKKNKEAEAKKKQAEEQQRKSNKSKDKKDAEEEAKRREELRKQTEENNKKREAQSKKKES